MIFVVIPVHNRKLLTRRCLECLQKQTVSDITVIVIDDGSTDGTADMVRTEFPDAVLLVGNGDLWWTEATNVGIRYAIEHCNSTEENFILTLNDDTEVNSDYVHTLLSTYNQHKPCLVGSACLDVNNPNWLEYAGVRMNLLWSGETHFAARFGNDYQKALASGPVIESDSLPGRGVLIPLDVFSKVGLFDSVHFIQYMADIEFSVRARKAGYKLLVSLPGAVYGHIEATGLQMKPDLSFRKFWKGLSSTRSPINLTVRYNFAMRHSSTKWLYFSLDVGRIIMGYFIRKVRLNA
ncbi:glycosyltransferase family 2 protein [Spirosoma sordidisoli]|uniref:Glycosyltransferase family 2 protein n=1 Tax=Spirosoma sordidisoli TaxID=2502893 RepID=A0A4Q2UP37_9BACT|nr:glycosyltransferase family 2 protein [Spirosoma sordidisoli]RYC71477.1 glycosyltransferase family 2 protein [Spirosoma sordidisoli]